MIEILPNQTYVAIPSNVSKMEFNTIAGYFDQIPEIQVVYGRELPESHYIGVNGPAIIEFSKWVINFSPEILKELTTLTMETYTGKKLVSGFATPLGRQSWNGVKLLGDFINENFSRHSNDGDGIQPVMQLKSNGRSKDGGPYFDLTISISLPREELMLQDVYYEIRRYFFPMIGFLANESSDEIRLSIGPERRSNWPWSVWNHDTNVIYGVDFKKRVFKQLSSDTAQKNEPIKQCLLLLGLTNYLGEPWWKRLVVSHTN